MQDALVIQKPVAAAEQLLLLFHGVGASPEDLRSLGQALAHRFPDAWVVNVRSPEPSDFGTGWQWFSVRGVDEASRVVRVADAMPRFVQAVRHWQLEAGLDAAATTLIGFSQGAIMSLESTQQPEPLAARLIAIAGRFAQPPRSAPRATALNLIHGENDGIMPSVLSVDAAQRLRELEAQVTLDLFPGLGHGIDDRVLARIVQRIEERPAEARAIAP
jgi:phospholipase/carboxylesterase